MIWTAALLALAALAGGSRGGAGSAARQYGPSPPPTAGALSCREPPRSFEHGDALGSWHLLRCFMEHENRCSDRNCLRLDNVTPQEQKNLSATHAARLPDVRWEQVVMRLMTPCAQAQDIFTLNYLERTASDQYKIIALPVSARDMRSLKPRSMRLQLLQGRYLVMLDCAELEPVLLVREAPPPGYKDDPVLAPFLTLLETMEY